MNDPGDEDDSVICALERHIDGCKTCRPWSICAVGSKLLQDAADKLARGIAPEPVRAGKA